MTLDEMAKQLSYSAMDLWRAADIQHENVYPWVGYREGYANGFVLGFKRAREMAVKEAEKYIPGEQDTMQYGGPAPEHTRSGKIASDIRKLGEE